MVFLLQHRHAPIPDAYLRISSTDHRLSHLNLVSLGKKILIQGSRA
jgi:hypothetical protein